MALHKTLPIYKAAKQLLKLCLELPKDMRKDAKYLIGKELLRESLGIMRMIRRMNIARDGAKAPFIEEILEKVQFIEDLVGACDDTHLITTKQYAQITPVIESIGRQAGGLKNRYATHA